MYIFIYIINSVHSRWFTFSVNRRKVYSNKDLQLLSNTDQASAFVHVCLKCTGQHGKILRFEDYLIRIGRFTLAQALLNVKIFCFCFKTIKLPLKRVYDFLMFLIFSFVGGQIPTILQHARLHGPVGSQHGHHRAIQRPT